METKLANDDIYRRTIENLQKQRERRVSVMQGELDALDKKFEIEKDQATSQSLLKLNHLTDLEKEKITNLNQKSENRLKEISQEIDGQKKQLEKRKEEHLFNHESELLNTDRVYKERVQNLLNEGNKRIQNVTNEVESKQRQIEDKGKREVALQNYLARVQMQENAEKNFQKIQLANKRFDDQLSNQKLNQQQDLAKLKMDHDRLMNAEKISHMAKLAEKQAFHQYQATQEEKHHKQMMDRLKQSNKQKYDTLKQNYDQMISTIKNRLDNEIRLIIESNSKDKQFVADRVQDPFYHLTKINPQVQDTEKHYIISMKVPAHEKDLVTVSARKRNITVNLARRFSDSTMDDTGAINKSKRSEIITKTFSVPAIVENSGVTTKYDNGVLSFKIKKA